MFLMADYASIRCGMQLQCQIKARCVQSEAKVLLLRNLCTGRTCFGTLNVNYFSGFPKLTTSFAGRRSYIATQSRCCIQPIIGSEIYVFPPEWMLSIDQALLTISILFAYLAGVIPHGKTFPKNSLKDKTIQHSAAARDALSGRFIEFGQRNYWEEVKMKLSDALEMQECNVNLHRRQVEFKKCTKADPLSLFAIDEGPKLRLLLITLQHLQMKANTVQKNTNARPALSDEFFKSLVQPVLIKWLEEELALVNGKSENRIMEAIIGRSDGDERIYKRFSRSGKADLYENMLSFLRSGTLWSGSRYDAKFISEHGVEILEDLVIFVADGISSIYLELISVDSSLCSEIDSLSFRLCSLSTRALQRLRNEVALNWWLFQYFESVVSMYEDRFELYIMCRKQQEQPLAEKIDWWKGLVFRKTLISPVMHYIEICHLTLSVKRADDLRSLDGWRYYFSLFLELSDMVLPLITAMTARISDAMSFFFKYMIGRSLGLIFSGIKQSLGLGWK